jgi:hypothetical protein
MKILSSLGSYALVLVSCVVGCAGGGGDDLDGDSLPGDSSDLLEEDVEPVLAAARVLGFDENSVEFVDGRIIIEGDIEVERDSLLRQAEAALRYQDSVSAESSDEVEKGFFVSSLGRQQTGSTPTPSFQVPRATSINLSFDTNVPAVWQTAFAQAAAAWNNSCINIRIGSGTDGIRVRMDGSLDSRTLGVGTFPTLTQGARDLIGDEVALVGAGIRINSNASVTAAKAFHVATHELGHNLGFTHPGGGSHIGSTGGVGVATIMAPEITNPPLAALTSDDLSSRNSIYRITTRRVPDQSGRGTVTLQVCPNGLDIVGFN